MGVNRQQLYIVVAMFIQACPTCVVVVITCYLHLHYLVFSLCQLVCTSIYGCGLQLALSGGVCGL